MRRIVGPMQERAKRKGYTSRKPRVRYGQCAGSASRGRRAVFNQLRSRSTNPEDLPARKGTDLELEGSLTCA